jgi:hypothetical protein
VRCLVVGCGCRGLTLARALKEHGHAVRGTTRNPARGAVLEAAGVEPVIADPDRVGSLVPALEHVSAVCLLLGSAAGDREAVAALHGFRLEMLLSKLIDTTVRGVIYEGVGTVPREVLDGGAELVRQTGQRSHIRNAVLGQDPGDTEAWVREAQAAVEAVVAQLDSK